MARAKIAKVARSASGSGPTRRRPSFGKRNRRAISGGSDTSQSATSSDEETNIHSHNRAGMFQKNR